MSNSIRCVGGTILLIFFTLLITPNSAIAQETFEEWKEKQKKEYEAFEEKWDREFLKHLEEAWIKVKIEDTARFYEKKNRPLYRR